MSKRVFQSMILAVAFLRGPAVNAQATCGLTNVTETKRLEYPSIARAARIQGTVIILAQFLANGQVENARVLTGIPMLRGAAVSYVKGLNVNAYSGPRECPVVVDFVFGGESADPKVMFERRDLQNVRITAQDYPPVVMYSVAVR